MKRQTLLFIGLGVGALFLLSRRQQTAPPTAGNLGQIASNAYSSLAAAIGLGPRTAAQTTALTGYTQPVNGDAMFAPNLATSSPPVSNPVAVTSRDLASLDNIGAQTQYGQSADIGGLAY